MWNAFLNDIPLVFDRVTRPSEWNHRTLNGPDLRSAVAVERDHVLDAVRMVMTSGWDITFQEKNPAGFD